MLGIVRRRFGSEASKVRFALSDLDFTSIVLFDGKLILRYCGVTVFREINSEDPACGLGLRDFRGTISFLVQLTMMKHYYY